MIPLSVTKENIVTELASAYGKNTLTTSSVNPSSDNLRCHVALHVARSRRNYDHAPLHYEDFLFREALLLAGTSPSLPLSKPETEKYVLSLGEVLTLYAGAHRMVERVVVDMKEMRALSLMVSMWLEYSLDGQQELLQDRKSVVDLLGLAEVNHQHLRHRRNTTSTARGDRQTIDAREDHHEREEEESVGHWHLMPPLFYVSLDSSFAETKRAAKTSLSEEHFYLNAHTDLCRVRLQTHLMAADHIEVGSSIFL